MASEVEETLKRLVAHKGVIGTIVVNNDGIPIKSTLDNHTTTQYSGLINQLVDQVIMHTFYQISPHIFLFESASIHALNVFIVLTQRACNKNANPPKEMSEVCKKGKAGTLGTLSLKKLPTYKSANAPVTTVTLPLPRRKINSADNDVRIQNSLWSEWGWAN